MKLCKLDEVRTNCPVTCGLCCEDDPSYTFINDMGIEKTCGWITLKDVRKSKYCDKYKSGMLVRVACPKACDYCKAPIY